MNGAVSGTIAREAGLLACSFLFGIALMLLYDVVRIFRHMKKHGTFFLAAEDILYWLICSVGIFAMLYQENDGLLRWFVLGGVALGMLFENGVISPFVIHLAVKVLRFWQRIFGRIFGAAKKPGRKVFLFL